MRPPAPPAALRAPAGATSSTKASGTLRPGARLRLETPGGGGFGPPGDEAR